MRIHLNGWRRIALTMTMLWIGTATVITASEFVNKSDGYFAYQSIPVGTVVKGDTATLPDGRKAQISDQEEIEFSVRREREEGKPPIPVQMPDGTIVEMPNKLTPELATRLKAMLRDPSAAASLAAKDQLTKQDGDKKGFDLATAREVKPWDIYWSKQDSIPKTTEIRWPRLLLLGFAVPLLLWMFTELFTGVIRWINRGFKESTS